MREQRFIVDRWRRGSGTILVTLVRVQGSSYRRPGARLLLCEDGSYEGSISAGCLETDLLRKAAWLTRDGAVTHRYSTVSDDLGEIPFGLGCGGVIDLLLEPARTPECAALLQAMERSLDGCEQIVATWLPVCDRPMQRAIYNHDGTVAFQSSSLTDEAVTHARLLCLDKRHAGSEGLCIEHLASPQRLFVFGAGDDAKPLVSMACLLGWSVTLADGRSHLARKERFPEANVRVLPVLESAYRQVFPRDAVVVMTHSYEQDRECLAALLPTRPRYLGLLGSRRRSALLVTEVADRLDLPVSECCELINAPIGLDIGGEGPEAIALAILAEAQACCNGNGSQQRRLSAELVQQYLSGTTSPERQLRQPRCSILTT